MRLYLGLTIKLTSVLIKTTQALVGARLSAMLHCPLIPVSIFGFLTI